MICMPCNRTVTAIVNGCPPIAPPPPTHFPHLSHTQPAFVRHGNIIMSGGRWIWGFPLFASSPSPSLSPSLSLSLR